MTNIAYHFDSGHFHLVIGRWKETYPLDDSIDGLATNKKLYKGAYFHLFGLADINLELKSNVTK
jgi:hypothetical protein